MSQLDVERLFLDNTTLPCNYEGSEFINHDHKNSLTSNLKIIRDDKLRKLFTKRPKYQENKTTLFEKVKLLIIAGLNEPIKTCINHDYVINLFNEWKSKAFQKVDFRIHHLSRKRNIKKSSCTLREDIVRQNLKDLHS